MKLNSLIQDELNKIEKNKAELNVIDHYSKIYTKCYEKLQSYMNEKYLQIHSEESLFIIKNCRDKIFKESFLKINKSVRDIYTNLTGGGMAELEFESDGDPFEGGLRYYVRPPNKSWNKICNLSGGEKTLASLALIFALHELKPCPFYIMDEIDAALDIKNCTSVADAIRNICKSAQCIVITLRCDLYEQAPSLIGVYKLFDCTKNMVIKPHYEVD
eukprot:Mrub_10352.p1 GENE.Mrub_10352~~Mrub_10352.p1  ORF type:complete len:227 (-),score=55.83 Mrub_10352:6-653(-)